MNICFLLLLLVVVVVICMQFYKSKNGENRAKPVTSPFGRLKFHRHENDEFPIVSPTDMFVARMKRTLETPDDELEKNSEERLLK